VSILELLVLTAQELDLSFDSIIYSVLVESVADYEIPESVLFHCLRYHSIKHETMDDDHLFELSEVKFSRTIGHSILKQIDDAMDLDSFMEKWKAECPQSRTLDVKVLKVLFC
jgi:hypothetical protein